MAFEMARMRVKFSLFTQDLALVAGRRGGDARCKAGEGSHHLLGEALTIYWVRLSPSIVAF